MVVVRINLYNNNNDKINNNKDTINNNNDKINNTTTTTPTPPTTTPLLYLQHLFYQLLTHTDIQIKPFIIKSNIFTDTNTHQDIHEYSKIFFDFLEKEYKGSGGCGSNSSSSNSSSSNNIRDIRDIRDTNNNPNTTTDNNNPNTTNNTTTDNNNNPTTTNNNNPSNNNNTTTNNNNPNTTNNNTTNNNNNPPPNTTITPTNNNNTPSTNPNNIIDGLLLNYIHCIDCNCKSTNKEHFQDLQVDIRDYNNNNISNTLNNSLKILFNKEILEGNNMYKCNIHGHVRAIKGMCLYKGPSVLFILIKRFNIDYETGEGYKINDYFEYPEVLEMVEGEGGGVGGEGEFGWFGW
ncbi:hypothetical protein LUQ84_001710 [Hamiltosporidium tvaerminnensis]|nr:hypothetical protein LUQ84_001710 [Hamiltosporidium tvaerminnensis]